MENNKNREFISIQLGEDWNVSLEGKERQAPRLVNDKLATILLEKTSQLIFLDIASENGIFNALLVDISKGGCRFLSNQEFVEGEDLDITIGLTGWEISGNVIIKRVVKYGSSYEIAVEFQDLTEEDENYISRILIPGLLED